MAKTLLIPIDFTVASLNTLKLALDEHEHEPVHVVLMYAHYLTTSISDLLFYSPGRIIKSLTTQQFTDALNIIQNSYESRLASLRIHLFHGFSSSAFRNFHEGRNVDVIYVSSNYALQPKKNGFDPTPMIRDSKLKTVEVTWNRNTNSVGDINLDQLF